MDSSLHDILAAYDDQAPLEQACTIPASWYVDERIAELERQNVLGRTWQVMAGVDQVVRPGEFVTAELSGEPLVIVRGSDGQLRAFYNVCRHHAAAVVTEEHGTASIFRCPYHGWSYGLDGSLKGAPEFNAQTNDNKILRQPIAAVHSADRNRWILTAWQIPGRSWGNPLVPCMHADPKLPDCPFRKTVRARGRLWFYEGRDIEREIERRVSELPPVD